jgi:hypothetical protein
METDLLATKGVGATRRNKGLTSAICFSTVYSTRLFELVAEEIAIEDTIYYLGKALSQDKVELNAYMKV